MDRREELLPLTHLRDAMGEIARLRGLLARLEWVETAFPRNTRACPACDNEPREGHESDCCLAAAIAGNDET